jgi:DNA-binding CsgD family transcriptional regulator
MQIILKFCLKKMSIFMEELVFSDTESLCQSIQQLYTLRNLDTFGVDALLVLNQLVPSDIPCFHVIHTQNLQVFRSHLPDFPGLTAAQEKVIHRYFGEHPITRNMPQTLNGAYKVSDFVSQKELHCLEGLYQQFFRPLGLEDQMILSLPNANPVNWYQLSQVDTTLVGASLNRGQRSFTERDRLILNLLRPHLFQAYCNVQHYQQLQQALSQLQQTLNHLNLVILNADGCIQSIAPQAILWLENYFAKPTCSHQLPDHLWSWIKYQIAGLTKNLGIPKACLPLRIQQVGKELVIRLVVEQLGARYLLLLEEQILSPMNSLALLGLSQRETEVLACVMQGKDNKAIATHLSINVSTVRKHLESIYSKFGVHSRTEAIAQTLAKLGLLQI